MKFYNFIGSFKIERFYINLSSTLFSSKNKPGALLIIKDFIALVVKETKKLLVKFRLTYVKFIG